MTFNKRLTIKISNYKLKIQRNIKNIYIFKLKTFLNVHLFFTYVNICNFVIKVLSRTVIKSWNYAQIKWRYYLKNESSPTVSKINMLRSGIKWI